jgi:ribonuclease HI
MSNKERPGNELGIDEQVQRHAFKPQNRAKAITVAVDIIPCGYHNPRRVARLRNPEKETLIYTSGQCHGKDRKKGNPGNAGCALIFGSESGRKAKPIGFILEQRGPSGAVYAGRNEKTAELRALVAALEFKMWSTECWEKVVIATTSAYVHKGITEHIATWAGKGWLQGAHFQGKQMLNSDLWERALALVNEQAYRGCEVQFWLVTGEDALEVEAAALVKAKMSHAPPKVYQSLGNVDIT